MKYDVSAKGYFDFISQNKINASILFSVGILTAVLYMKYAQKR
jgi:hypothetical protein